MREPLENVKTITIKVVVVTALLFIVLGAFYGEEAKDIIMISLLLCVISYYVGDLVILPLTNNLIATISDFGLAFLIVWLTGISFFNSDTPVLAASFFTAVVVALGEYVLHMIMQRVMNERRAG